MGIELALTRLDRRGTQAENNLSTQNPVRPAKHKPVSLFCLTVPIPLWPCSRRKTSRGPSDGPDDTSHQHASRRDQTRPRWTVVIDDDPRKDGQDPVDQGIGRGDCPVPSIVHARDFGTDGGFQGGEGRVGKVGTDYSSTHGCGSVFDAGPSPRYPELDSRVRKMIQAKAGPLYFQGLSTPPAVL